jgi:hypothetical protein
MKIQDPTGNLQNLLKAAETGRLSSIKSTVRVTASPFEDMASLRPPQVQLPPSAGLNKLRALFGKAIKTPTPATRGLFEVMARGAISPAMVDYIIANRFTVEHLQKEAKLLRPQLQSLPTVGFVTGHAALDLVAKARHFGDLTESAAVRGRLGQLVAARAAVEMAPFKKAIQPAIMEVLATGGLSQQTLSSLQPKDVKDLVSVLKRELPMIAQLPADNSRLLTTAVRETAKTLSKDVKASAADIRGAVNNALSPADQKTYQGNFSYKANPTLELGGTTTFDTGIKPKTARDPNAPPSLIDKAFNALPEIEKSGEAHFHKEGKVEAASAGSYDGKLGTASYEANAKITASVDAHAKGSIKISKDGLEASGEAGFRVELGAEANVKAKANLFGGLVQFDGQASVAVKAEVHANVSGAVSIGRDANGNINFHAKGALDVGASLEATAKASGSANIAGIQVSGEAYAGVMVGVRAAASGELGYKDGKITAGFRIKLALGIGIDFGFKFSIGVPKWLRDFGGTLRNIGGTIKNAFKKPVEAVKKVGEAIGSAAKAVGNAVGGAVKAVGKFFSKL